MKIRSEMSDARDPGRRAGAATQRRRLLGIALVASGTLFIIILTAAPVWGRQMSAPQATAPQATKDAPIENVKCVIGLEDIKLNARGALSVQGGGLHFETGKKRADVSVASIQDIFVGDESRQDITGPVGTIAKAAIPYGGGRVVSLFSHGVQVLTVDYRDSDGGLHGTIFVLPPGEAGRIKKELVEQGAKASIPPADPAQAEKKP